MKKRFGELHKQREASVALGTTEAENKIPPIATNGYSGAAGGDGCGMTKLLRRNGKGILQMGRNSTPAEIPVCM